MANVCPEQGEIVIATVKKIMEFGAFCTLDEYNAQDAFVHISEVSSGWIRSVRDYVKENQKIVAQVIRIDRTKNQIDLSIKRVNDAERKRKMEVYNLSKRALKLMERVAIKLGKNLENAKRPVIDALNEKYGTLYDAFELASQGEEITCVPKQWAQIIGEVAKQEIKTKLVCQRVVLKLKSFSSNGVNEVKKILKDLEAISTDKIKIKVRYVGAPVYYLDITVENYKTAEKTLSKIEKFLSTLPNSFDWQLKKDEK